MWRQKFIEKIISTIVTIHKSEIVVYDTDCSGIFLSIFSNSWFHYFSNSTCTCSFRALDNIHSETCVYWIVYNSRFEIFWTWQWMKLELKLSDLWFLHVGEVNLKRRKNFPEKHSVCYWNRQNKYNRHLMYSKLSICTWRLLQKLLKNCQ